MIVGIDIGGSTTDAVILENGGLHVVTIEANDPVAAAAGALGKLVADFGIKLEDVECVAATSAGSRVLTKSLLGRPVIKEQEFTAIGIGGTSLAGLERALVVSFVFFFFQAEDGIRDRVSDRRKGGGLHQQGPRSLRAVREGVA